MVNVNIGRPKVKAISGCVPTYLGREHRMFAYSASDVLDCTVRVAKVLPDVHYAGEHLAYLVSNLMLLELSGRTMAQGTYLVTKVSHHT